MESPEVISTRDQFKSGHRALRVWLRNARGIEWEAFKGNNTSSAVMAAYSLEWLSWLFREQLLEALIKTGTSLVDVKHKAPPMPGRILKIQKERRIELQRHVEQCQETLRLLDGPCSWRHSSPQAK